MNLELLRTFIEVDRARHFGRAATQLHVTQASVSARINQLEDELGVRLFDRRRREVQPTLAGRHFRDQANSMLQAWRKTKQEVAALGATDQVAIGGSLRLWDVVLQGWLHALRRANPTLAIVAESCSPELLITQLLDGALDFAFMLEPTQLEVLQVIPVASLELAMFSTQPLSVRDALAERYVWVDWGITHEVEFARLFPDAPESLTRLPRAKVAFEYLKEFGGSAYLPLSLIRDSASGSSFYQVPDAPVLSRTIYAVYPTHSARLPLINRCMRQIAKLNAASTAGRVRINSTLKKPIKRRRAQSS